MEKKTKTNNAFAAKICFRIITTTIIITIKKKTNKTDLTEVYPKE